MTEQSETWTELRTKLTHYVRSKVGVDASEDLVHDILLSVLQNKNKLSEVDNPLAWIYTIAKNTIVDYYRKQSKIKTTYDVDSLDIDSVDWQALSNEADNDFAACLRPLTQTLDTKYQQAVLLADFNGIKQADAARQVGISLSGMKSRVQRGRAKLKEELLACCEIEVDRFGKVIDYKKHDENTKGCC